jgi:hypothetical protein
MNFGVAVLLIISGWALLSIVVSLGVGEIAKTRDRGPLTDSLSPANLEDVRTDRARQDRATRRSA